LQSGDKRHDKHADDCVAGVHADAHESSGGDRGGDNQSDLFAANERSGGSLDVGKYADLAAFDVADYREIPYYFGVNLCCAMMKRDAMIYSKDSQELPA
jgi:hypothetical protein